MAKATDVERAFERCSILKAIVQHVRDDALARPSEAVWTKLGLTQPGERSPDARARMERLFDEMQALIEHVFVLDMAAQFERASLARVKNYIGEARSASKRAMAKSKLPTLSSGVIKEASHYESMDAVLKLLEGHVDEELFERLDAIRRARNVFAHGIDVMAIPIVSREEVRDSLTDALAAM